LVITNAKIGKAMVKKSRIDANDCVHLATTEII
jgi:hypothetical protein